MRIFVVRFHNREEKASPSGRRNRKFGGWGSWLPTVILCAVLIAVAGGAVAEAGGNGETIYTIINNDGNEIGEMVPEATEARKIAITFDDGPNADYTEMLLAGLKERGVHATFFLLGREVAKYPEIVKQIYEDGHLIGTHAYDHVNLKNLSDAAAIDQVDRTNAAICEIVGECPQYIRPPFGEWKKKLDYDTKMIEVLWDVDPLDWMTCNSDVIAKRVISKVQENDIILLHDASESSVKAAFKIIDELQTRGYVFVTVDEILFD